MFEDLERGFGMNSLGFLIISLPDNVSMNEALNILLPNTPKGLDVSLKFAYECFFIIFTLIKMN